MVSSIRTSNKLGAFEFPLHAYRRLFRVVTNPNNGISTFASAAYVLERLLYKIITLDLLENAA